MTRQEYVAEFRRLRRSREFRKSKIPKDVFEFGWEIAKFKPQNWIVNRILFWLYAYDRTHKWTNQDFLYEINDEAYEKAKAKRKERREKRREYAIKKHNKPIAFPKISETSWEEAEGSLERTLKSLGVQSLSEAVFPEGIPKAK